MQNLREKFTIQFKANLRDNEGYTLDGLYDSRSNTMLINADMKLRAKAITLFHEAFHYLNHKAFNLRATPILNQIIDYSNFLIEKNNLKLIIKARFGLKSLKRKIANQIKLIDSLSQIYARLGLNYKKQLKLSDFPEFKPICDSFDKSVKDYRDMRKKLNSRSNELKQTVLAPIPEKSLKKEVV